MIYLRHPVVSHLHSGLMVERTATLTAISEH
jgi:hypothetical protein